MEDGPETEQPAHTGPGRPAIDSRTSEGREQVYPWDQERRARLRAELDAACFWLMGMSEEEAAYVLDTFPIVRRKEVSRYGRYRSRELIIDAYRSITVGEQEFRTSRVETDGSSLRR